MLKNVPSRKLQIHVYRMAIADRIDRLLKDQQLDPQSVAEIKELLQSRGVEDSVDELCDAPFRPKTRLDKHNRRLDKHNKPYGEGRFSNGSFPVFYAALEAETADAEILYWFPKRFPGSDPIRVFYDRLKYDFNGNIKDLRTMQKKWPKLTHDSDYRFCNKLGAEAVKEKIDGFLTPSVRKKNGTNVPIFSRESIRDPRVITTVSLTRDPETKRVTVESL